MALNLQAPIQYEPKSTNRFILEFPTDIGIQTFQVVSCTAPKMNIITKEMAFINMKTYVALAYDFAPITIVLRDFIAPSTAQAVMEWLRLCAESLTGRMGYAIGYAKDFKLHILDPTGAPVETWVLEKCIPSGEQNFGDMNYNNQEVREITITVQPQKCEQLF